MRAIDAALVMSAEHELSAPTFAARICASTGADLHACVATAMLTQSGPMQVGGAVEVEALIDDKPKKKQSPWTWPLIALIVLLLLVLGGTLFALFANQGASPAPTSSSATAAPTRTTAPPSPTPSSTTVALADLGFIGKTCDEALQIANDHELTGVTCERGTAAPSGDTTRQR